MSQEFRGNANVVVRIGDTVHRPMPARAPYIHALLNHFEGAGWAGAPRFLGTDDEGRQILSWVPGTVVEPKLVGAPEVWTVECLSELVWLVRRMHDLTVGSGLCGADEVVCHRDLAPRNVVVRRADPHAPYRPVAIIDWDKASPGARIEDIAYLCWQFLISAQGEVDVDVVAHRMRVVCDAYGLDDRSSLVESVISSQEGCWRGTEAAARAGDEACIELCRNGTVAADRDAQRWTVAHRRRLEASLTYR